MANGTHAVLGVSIQGTPIPTGARESEDVTRVNTTPSAKIHRDIKFGFGTGAFFSAAVSFVTVTHPSDTMTPAMPPPGGRNAQEAGCGMHY